MEMMENLVYYLLVGMGACLMVFAMILVIVLIFNFILFLFGEDETEVYVVLSRDNGSYIYCTTDEEDAEVERKRQFYDEEMSGGRPSVYVRKTTLKG
jgi:uncharacterized membrane protein YqiK